jgi:spermidine/putrescine-binding protein
VTGPQQQHDDAFGEARAQLVQGLAVLATVSEAVARWYAVGLQRRAEDQAKADRAAQISQAAREQAEQLAREAEVAEDRAERQHVARAFDDDWLGQADLAETARLWRTANLRAAGGDEWAREGMQRAEQRLRQIRPNLMVFYDRFRSEGRTPAQAMQAAAYAAWMAAENSTVGPQARAHPSGTERPDPGRTGVGPGWPAAQRPGCRCTA